METNNKKMYGKTLKVNTYYTSQQGQDLDAKAVLIINDSGEYYIDKYDYLDPNTSEWVNTQERDWRKEDIEITFNIQL